MIRTLLLLLLLAATPVFAQPPQKTVPAATVPTGHSRVHRDAALEKAAAARARRLAAILQPQVRARLDLAAGKVLKYLSTGPGRIDPEQVARRDVREGFPGLSEAQADLLTFYVLAEATEQLTRLDTEQKDGKSSMSQQNAMRLQMALDRRSKFVQTLSNLMKKITTTQDTLVENVK